MDDAPGRPHVVIVGGGFGGLNAARKLADAPVDVTLVDRNNYHLFQPLLYQVATAGLEPAQIAKPIRSILRSQENLDFRMAQVSGIDLGNRQIETDEGRLAYDYLIVAVGAQVDHFGMEGVAAHGLKLKDLSDAVFVRNHILRCFERAVVEEDEAERRRLLTFVIVGGGPTGVEMTGALTELVHLVLLRDYPDLDSTDVSIILLEMMDHLLPGFDTGLSEAARAKLVDKGADVRLRTAVEDYDGAKVTLANGNGIDARTLLWAAGVRAGDLVGTLGFGVGRAGRVQVEQTLQLPGHPELYVIGDAAYLEAEGKPLPMMAPVAIQMADLAVKNIQRDMRGEALVPFAYHSPGQLATIGRNAAVADIAGWRFKGFIAWGVWLVVHLIQLIGFRSRLVVLINWAWDYFFYERAVRLISEPEPTIGPEG
ncbi:MAG: NAD(P)/FAD-dependent oxidoreductase [Anaerolineales bacterium]